MPTTLSTLSLSGEYIGFPIIRFNYFLATGCKTNDIEGNNRKKR